MRLDEVARLVGAKVYTGEDMLDLDIDSAFSSDTYFLMEPHTDQHLTHLQPLLGVGVR